MKTYKVTLMNGLEVKKVIITLGDKSEFYDVEQAVRRQGHKGEIINIVQKGSLGY